MLEIVKLAHRRTRSPADYRKMQEYIAEHAVGELEKRGVHFGDCDVLETGAGKGGYSKILHPKAKSFLANDLVRDPFFDENSVPFKAFDLVKEFPLEPASFDLIYSSSVVEHVPDPGRYLRECHRVLRDNGTLYLSFPPFYTLAMIGAHGYQPFHYLGEQVAVYMYNLRRRANVRCYAETWEACGLYPLTIAGVSKLLADSGFSVSDTYTRMCPINTTRLPGPLKDLFTWHVCFLARKADPPR